MAGYSGTPLPKKLGIIEGSRGVPVTLLENGVRELGLAAGLVANKGCAIDERWSGLRFVYRLADRPGKVATR